MGILDIIIFIVAVVVFILVLGSFFTVSTATVAVITRFGKFLRIADPGLNWKWPIIDSVADRVSPARPTNYADDGNQNQR